MVETVGPGLHRVEQGAGEPLVLVHGLGGNTGIWQWVVPALAERLRVVAYDLRGLGRSAPAPARYDLDVLLDDLDAVVTSAGDAAVRLLGHSLGGAVVLAYAASRPERVRALVGVAAPSGTPAPQAAGLRERARRAQAEGMEAMAELHVATGLPEPFRAAHPAETEAYRRVIAAGSPAGYAALCEVIATLDLTAELRRVRAPALLVQGELDAIVPAASARETAAAIPGCEYAELVGCGHVVPVERPTELARLALAFLSDAAG